MKLSAQDQPDLKSEFHFDFFHLYALEKTRDKEMAWGRDKESELFFSIQSPCHCAKSHAKKYQDGLSEGYEIVCMDGSFHVHEYCLYYSEFLYNMLEGLDFYKKSINFILNFRPLKNHFLNPFAKPDKISREKMPRDSI